MSILRNKVLLKIKAEDQTTEIFVIDGDFDLAARGVGEMEVSLEPGIYKIKLRVGLQTAEKMLVLRGDKKEELLKLDALEFSSSAPLANTSRTHQFQIQRAQTLAGQVQEHAGKGSWIYLFAREWTSKEMPSPLIQSSENPAKGLTLRNMQGELVADLASKSEVAGGWDPCAGCNVEVNPGTYCLRLTLPNGMTVDRLLVASNGWQTQVFLMQREYSREPEMRAPDISGGSVLLSHSMKFDAQDPSHRLADMTRLAMSSSRRRVSEQLRQSLKGKIDNPMLGIYGAHLLLLDTQPDYELLREVISQLRASLGQHPDVEALALKLPGANTGGYIFKEPPMLRRSWSYVIEATCAQPSLVPPDSLAGNIATRLWGDGSWMVWTTESATANATAPSRAPRARSVAPSDESMDQSTGAGMDETAKESLLDEALIGQLRSLQKLAEAKKHATDSAPLSVDYVIEYLTGLMSKLMPALHGIVDTLFKAEEKDSSTRMKVPVGVDADDAKADDAEADVGPFNIILISERPGGVKEIVDDEHINKLVQTFGIPKANVEKLLNDIEKRLGAVWNQPDH